MSGLKGKNCAYGKFLIVWLYEKPPAFQPPSDKSEGGGFAYGGGYKRMQPPIAVQSINYKPDRSENPFTQSPLGDLG